MLISAQKWCRRVSEKPQMSEKSHTSPPSFQRIFRAGWPVWAVCWLILFTFVYFLAHWSRPLLDALAARDPDPARLTRLDSLRATRALLLPAGQNASSAGAQLWAARRSGAEAGFFLAGAVRAERAGQPATARLWLALELLGRGDRAGAGRVLRDAGTSLTLNAEINPREPATWEATPLGRALRQSSVGDIGR
jgi:hypothetical protein